MVKKLYEDNVNDLYLYVYVSPLDDYHKWVSIEDYEGNEFEINIEEIDDLIKLLQNVKEAFRGREQSG